MSHPYRRRFRKLVALIGSGLLLATNLAVLPPPTSAIAASTKLVVIPLENESYDDIIGSSQAPYLNQLISQGTVFTQYTAVASGSNPNYLAMTSGLTSALTPPSPNVFQAIDASGGLTWKALMESMTGTCAAGTTGTVPGSTDALYTADHDPAYSYRGNTSCTTNDVPLTSSSLSASNLPSFSYVVPNECNDMHTPVPAGQSCPAFFGPNSGNSPVNMGDNWLSTVVPSLLAQSNVTVLITWDESRTSTVPWSTSSRWKSGRASPPAESTATRTRTTASRPACTAISALGRHRTMEPRRQHSRFLPPGHLHTPAPPTP